jgi:subtilase family serine protease
MMGFGWAYYNSAYQLVSGTSISAPMFASVIALLDDERISAGKTPLPGWINPTLYSVPSAFNDITSGEYPATVGMMQYLNYVQVLSLVPMVELARMLSVPLVSE